MTYYTNKGAVHFEMKNFDECIKACDQAIELSKDMNHDSVKLSKAFSRKGNALLMQKKFDESIDAYQKALAENNDHGIKMGLQKAQKMKREHEDLAYINPEIAE